MVNDFEKLISHPTHETIFFKDFSEDSTWSLDTESLLIRILLNLLQVIFINTHNK